MSATASAPVPPGGRSPSGGPPPSAGPSAPGGRPRVGDRARRLSAAPVPSFSPASAPPSGLLGDDEPITPEALARLAALDVESMSDADLVGLMASWARVRAYADGQIARAVVTLRERAPAAGVVDPDQLVAAEVAASLRLGTGGADRLVSTATGLAARFPATLAAVQDGSVSWAKATTLVEQASVLDDAAARLVEVRVLPLAADRTPAQHADAVRRAVDRVDPAAADERRRRAQRDIDLVRVHLGDGMGELFARIASEQLDTVWLGADAWARRRKAAGDGRTLGQLRVAALVQWAQSFLTHGDPSRCDYDCEWSADADVHPDADADTDTDTGGAANAGGVAGAHGAAAVPVPAGPDESADADVDQPAASAGAPRRHGRPIRLAVLWDVASLLGVSPQCGELADTGATVPPDAMRELLAAGATVRRLLVDAATGELIDLSTEHVSVAPIGNAHAHRPPVELRVVVTTEQLHALRSDDADPLAAALAEATPRLRALLLAPVTAADLDRAPDAYPAPARLAEFVAVRDRHPTNPSAGLTAAGAGDVDHVVPARAGGPTVRENLHSPTRRWHRLRTLGFWTVVRQGRGWRWTSWTGRTVTTRPHDYRLGP